MDKNKRKRLLRKYDAWFEQGAWRFPSVWHKEQFEKEAAAPQEPKALAKPEEVITFQDPNPPGLVITLADWYELANRIWKKREVESLIKEADQLIEIGQQLKGKKP